MTIDCAQEAPSHGLLSTVLSDLDASNMLLRVWIQQQGAEGWEAVMFPLTGSIAGIRATSRNGAALCPGLVMGELVDCGGGEEAWAFVLGGEEEGALCGVGGRNAFGDEFQTAKSHLREASDAVFPDSAMEQWGWTLQPNVRFSSTGSSTCWPPCFSPFCIIDICALRYFSLRAHRHVSSRVLPLHLPKDQCM